MQVQNKKLSERLKERNIVREQLEVRLEEAEGRVEEQRRALSSLPRHMLALKSHLCALLPDDMGLEGLSHLAEDARPEQCLEEGFRCALAALRRLSSGERREEREVSPQTTADINRLQDENRSLQNRCEDVENALADARYTQLAAMSCPHTTVWYRFDLERSVSRVMRLERQLAETMEHIQSSKPVTEESTQQAPPTAMPVLPAVSSEEVYRCTESDLEMRLLCR